MSNHPILDRLCQLVDTLDIEEETVIDFYYEGYDTVTYEHEDYTIEELGKHIAQAKGVNPYEEAALLELADEIAKLLLNPQEN